MASVTESPTLDWTAADLVERFGPVLLHRVRFTPPPGSATEHDVVEIHDREDRLYELADGVLMEKTVGTYESYLAGLLVRLLGNFVVEKDLGIVLPPDGMLRLAPGLVRIPDVSFISWKRLPERKVRIIKRAVKAFSAPTQSGDAENGLPLSEVIADTRGPRPDEAIFSSAESKML